jgi:hypothetical protein
MVSTLGGAGGVCCAAPRIVAPKTTTKAKRVPLDLFMDFDLLECEWIFFALDRVFALESETHCTRRGRDYDAAV